ncbi:hypothetical protein MTR_6g047990 [Medicago truncatula]|uniref:Uncharacterized protein n=1 Tax=Medicago truncatula TaxID=3880 RepID=A0A072U9X3_MEDTR|nr:hypothetical protein MTR_6g047990 [Medicago truncatula]
MGFLGKTSFLPVQKFIARLASSCARHGEAIRADCTLQEKVSEYDRDYDTDKVRPYARGSAPRFIPRGVTPGKMLATSAFATAFAPGKFPHKRPFSQGFCPFDKGFAPGKRGGSTWIGPVVASATPPQVEFSFSCSTNPT